MGGNIHQWVTDCWHKNYQGAPSDGSPWEENNCLSHVIRSGSWKNGPSYVRPSNRDHYDTGVRYPRFPRCTLALEGGEAMEYTRAVLVIAVLTMLPEAWSPSILTSVWSRQSSKADQTPGLG
jgi:hypothetical protein